MNPNAPEKDPGGRGLMDKASREEEVPRIICMAWAADLCIVEGQGARMASDEGEWQAPRVKTASGPAWSPMGGPAVGRMKRLWDTLSPQGKTV